MILQHGPLTICSFFVVNTESSAMGQLIPMADIQRKVSMFPREVDLSVCLKVFYCQFLFTTTILFLPYHGCQRSSRPPNRNKTFATQGIFPSE